MRDSGALTCSTMDVAMVTSNAVGERGRHQPAQHVDEGEAEAVRRERERGRAREREVVLVGVTNRSRHTILHKV